MQELLIYIFSSLVDILLNPLRTVRWANLIIIFNHSCILVLFRSLLTSDFALVNRTHILFRVSEKVYDPENRINQELSRNKYKCLQVHNRIIRLLYFYSCLFFGAFYERSELNAEKNIMTVSWVKRKKPPCSQRVPLGSMIIGSFCEALACGMSTIIIVLRSSAMVGSFRRATCELAKRRETPSSPRT